MASKLSARQKQVRATDYGKWSRTAADSADKAKGFGDTAAGMAEFYQANADSSELRGDFGIGALYGAMASAAEGIAKLYAEQAEAATELAAELAKKAQTVNIVRGGDRLSGSRGW